MGCAHGDTRRARGYIRGVAGAAACKLAGRDANGSLALREEPRDMTGAARTLLRMGGPSGGFGRGVNGEVRLEGSPRRISGRVTLQFQELYPGKPSNIN